MTHQLLSGLQTETSLANRLHHAGEPKIPLSHPERHVRMHLSQMRVAVF